MVRVVMAITGVSLIAGMWYTVKDVYSYEALEWRRNQIKLTGETDELNEEIAEIVRWRNQNVWLQIFTLPDIPGGI